MQRRQFLQQMMALPLLSLSPLTMAQTPPPRYLLLIELKGGNDSLNMLVPRQSAYYRARPSLAIADAELLKLAPHSGLNPVMAALEPGWAAGELAFVPGLGYPQPNRSHFRSIEIWETASAADEYRDEGWAAHSLRNLPLTAGQAAHAIVLGKDALAVSGEGVRTLQMNSAAQFARQARRLSRAGGQSANPALAHILAVQAGTADAANRMASDGVMPMRVAGKQQGGRFSQQLNDAATLISNGQAGPVIKLSLGSFDTHANQLATHNRLLKQLAQGLARFRQQMQAAGLWEQVLVMSYSEFGRRVAENGSRGTDHGTAATHLLMGGRVRGGILDSMPSLTELDAGDLRHQLDFRQLYSTLVQHWWQQPLPAHLTHWPALNLLKT